jgi:hypothetical protein
VRVLGFPIGHARLLGVSLFAYEAARAGLRLGQDAYWGTGSRAGPILGKLLSFFAGVYDGGDSIGQMRAGWLLAQGAPHTASVTNQASFIVPIGVAEKCRGISLTNRACSRRTR